MTSLYEPENDDPYALPDSVEDGGYIDSRVVKPYYLEENIGNTYWLFTTILPEWVVSAFTKRYALTDIQDYAKARQVLSVEDLAVVIAIGEMVYEECLRGPNQHWPNEIMPFLLYKDEAAMNEEQWAEYSGTVKPLSQTKAVRDSARTFLRGLPQGDKTLVQDTTCASINGEKAVPALKCRLAMGSDRLYIIVREGFSTDIENPDSRLIFHKSVLKALCTRSTIKAVTSTGWYRSYIAALVG